MLQSSFRIPVTRVITPLCQFLLKIGVSANLLSAVGGIGATVSAITFLTQGKYFWGVAVTLFFILFDLLDGTLARMSESGGSKWGALLDSTLDRISDAAIIGSVAYFLSRSHDRLVPVLLVALVAGSLVSYIKARAESLNIKCDGGIAERTERLIVIFLSLFLASFDIPYILAIGSWFLALISIYTAIERLVIVFQATRAGA